MLDPVGRCLTPDSARQLVALRADPTDQARIDELADKSTEGQLSPEERAEYEFYIAANNVIAILQAKARRVLAGNGSA
jgi:transglutaminase-like putative cysteine protease